MSENHTTIGVQLNYNHVLCSYRTGLGAEGLLDRTGGYGKLEVLFRLAYLVESDTWLVGEEVTAMDHETDLLFEGLLTRCVTNADVEIAGKVYTAEALVSRFLQEVIGYISQINPKAVIEQLRLSFPEGYARECIHGITMALGKLTTLEVVVLSNSTGGLSYVRRLTDEGVIWVDFDEEGLKAWRIPPKGEQALEPLLQMGELSLRHFSQVMESMVEGIYKGHTGKETLTTAEAFMVKAMGQTYLPLIFSKEADGQPLKLTFNQIYPPFQHSLSWETLNNVVEPFRQAFESAVSQLVDKGQRVICTGSGFRFLWAQQTVKRYWKDGGLIHWEGLALGLVSEQVVIANIHESTKAEWAYGIMLGQGKEQYFCPFTDENKPISDRKTSLVLMVPDWQEEVQLLRSDGDGQVEIVARLPIAAMENQAIQRVGLALTFEGDGCPQLRMKKLAL